MGGLEDSRADGVPLTPINTKLFENVDGFLVRLLSSFFLPVLMLTSIYFTTFTHDLEVENFEVYDPNLIGKEEIEGQEFTLYAFNIEEYNSPGCCADEERGWYPGLVTSAEEITILLDFNDRNGAIASGGDVFATSVVCPDGFGECSGKVASGGEVWIPFTYSSRHNIQGYVSFDNNFFEDANLVVAVDDQFIPADLRIILDKDKSTSSWYLSMAIAPIGFCVALFGATRLNMGSIKRGITLSNYRLDGSSSSYAICLLNTVMRPTIFAYYSSMMIWISIDGDWWNNPGGAFGAIIFGMVPALVMLFIKSSPIPEGRRMNLWGAIIYIPFCFFAVFIALLTFEGP